MTILLYLAKMILVSGLLYGYYGLFLRNRLFHRYNRYYLLMAAAVAAIVPFIAIPLHPHTQTAAGFVKTLQVINAGPWEEQGAAGMAAGSYPHWLTITRGIGLLYTTGVLCCALGLVRSLVYIARIRRKYQYEMIDRIRFYNTAEPGTPFSFFRIIFWNRDIPFDSRQGQQIFRHEWYHVQQRHSSDMLFLELLCSVAWFNPFFHLMRKEMKAIHEFLADEHALAPQDRLGYAELLVTHAIRQKNNGIAHPFSQHEIKRRILMITQSSPFRRTGGYFSRAMVFPMLMVLFSAFAFRVVYPVTSPVSMRSSEPMTVVIDAGHGGSDDGAWSGNVKEKDITLALAQKINELSGQYGVQVVLTRNSDELPGNASTKRAGLEKRVEITTEKKAALLLSLHVNNTGAAENTNPEHGFSAWISARRTDKNGQLLATALLQQLSTIYAITPAIRQRQGSGVYILDHSPCPAVILECGFIDKPEDRSFITDRSNQEKVARNILQGIVRYQQGK
ncbi:MAG TPA: M56/M15 family metallopeptidase [Puia sp.]|nr:M56/M15 family metallopeptidase [Puia sp.]